MGLLYISIAVFIIGLILISISHNGIEEIYAHLFASGVTAIISSCIVLSIFLSLLWSTNPSTDELRQDYMQLKVLSQSEVSFHQIERDELFRRIQLVNKAIDSHKRLHTNWLIGALYSKDIANLDYIR